jgi:hypothetical protein
MIADLDSAAQAIGIDSDALRAALQSGQTLAEVAQANGVDPQTVIDALVASAQSRISDDVAAGRLSQDDADRLTTDLESHIRDLVNGVAPQGPPDGAPGVPGPIAGGAGPGVGQGVVPGPSTTQSATAASA